MKRSIAVFFVLITSLLACTLGSNVPQATVPPKGQSPTFAATSAQSQATQAPPTQIQASATPAQGIGTQKQSTIDGMIELFVPAGKFIMGSGEFDSILSAPVLLSAFWIDKTEVTNAMFAKFVAATHYRTDAEKKGYGNVFDVAHINLNNYNQTSGATWQHPHGPASNLNGLDNYPVVMVSWNDATAYCQWAGRRLPTEAEWEKAARGPEGRIYPWGNTFDGTLANYCDVNCQAGWKDGRFNDGYSDTSPVGEYPGGASSYGVLDMAGNVYEWVADWYGPYSQSPQSNPTGPASGLEHIIRGGSWGDDPAHIRTAIRSHIVGDSWMDFIGFRCAR